MNVLPNPNMDRLQVRVVSELSKDGTVPLGYAAKLLNGWRDFVAAAACVEENPQPFFRRVTKAGLHYADMCRFGQVDSGNFLITIESFVPPFSQLSLPLQGQEHEEEHFNRRVMARIRRGLHSLEASVAEGDISPIVSDYRTGWNANMCEALLAMQMEQMEIALECRVDWSPNAPKPYDSSSTVRIEKAGFEHLQSAAQVLRDSDESMRRTIKGKVVKLSAAELEEEWDSHFVERVITVKTEIYDRWLKVNVPLSLREYKIACDAHKEVKDIQVEGIMERAGKQWQLVEPEHFLVLE
ncbi:MAG: hypothetical protein ACI35R_13905 [Bacillus sp. (in: firmicutes)]